MAWAGLVKHVVSLAPRAVVAAANDYTVAQVNGAAPLASPVFTGNPQAPVLWVPYTLAANLVAPSDGRAHIPGELVIPAGMLVDLSATSGHTLLEVW